MRALLAALAVSAAYPGAWATFAPRSFFADFPGAGRHWTAGLPAYSEHLVTDVGRLLPRVRAACSRGRRGGRRGS